MLCTLLTILSVVLGVLKLAGILTISWTLVLLPLGLAVTIVFIAMVFIIIAALLT